jgi:BlaI family transcriptional regulator, penicillinase repressor
MLRSPAGLKPCPTYEHGSFLCACGRRQWTNLERNARNGTVRTGSLTRRPYGEYIRLTRNYSLFLLTESMPKLKTVDLTRRESQIMEILYRRRRATVEEIRAELPDPPSPSSVRKLLDIMIERGLLARQYDGPRFVYFPAAKPEQASRSALKQLVRTFFDNSPGSAIAALLDMTSAPLSPAEHRRLRSLLDRAREQGDEQ